METSYEDLILKTTSKEQNNKDSLILEQNQGEQNTLEEKDEHEEDEFEGDEDDAEMYRKASQNFEKNQQVSKKQIVFSLNASREEDRAGIESDDESRLAIDEHNQDDEEDIDIQNVTDESFSNAYDELIQMPLFNQQEERTRNLQTEHNPSQSQSQSQNDREDGVPSQLSIRSLKDMSREKQIKLLNEQKNRLSPSQLMDPANFRTDSKLSSTVRLTPTVAKAKIFPQPSPPTARVIEKSSQPLSVMQQQIQAPPVRVYKMFSIPKEPTDVWKNESFYLKKYPV